MLGVSGRSLVSALGTKGSSDRSWREENQVLLLKAPLDCLGWCVVGEPGRALPPSSGSETRVREGGDSS